MMTLGSTSNAEAPQGGLGNLLEALKVQREQLHIAMDRAEAIRSRIYGENPAKEVPGPTEAPEPGINGQIGVVVRDIQALNQRLDDALLGIQEFV